MSRYDPQRRRRLTTRANTTAVEALLDGEPTRPRRAVDTTQAPALTDEGRGGAAGAGTAPYAARGGCLTALLGLGGRRS